MFIRSFGGAAAWFVAAAFAILAFSAAAEAQYITYVASNGNDANPCTVVTAPCKTLQKAVNAALANGTVRVLTPLTSSVFINKNITISGDGAIIIGQITIGGATAVVTLRGLALDGVGGYVNGIRIDSAAAVHIEDCTVERYTSSGIKLSATTATKLFVSNTVSRDNGGNGLEVVDTNAQVTVEASLFENNPISVGLYIQAAGANVIRSVASGNKYGIYLEGGTANVTETTAAGNSSHGFHVTGGAFATLTSSVARGNADNGLSVMPSASAVITDSVFTNNGVGITNRGTLYTYANNTNLSNTTDYGGDGVKTTVSPGF